MRQCSRRNGKLLPEIKTTSPRFTSECNAEPDGIYAQVIDGVWTVYQVIGESRKRLMTTTKEQDAERMARVLSQALRESKKSMEAACSTAST